MTEPVSQMEMPFVQPKLDTDDQRDKVVRYFVIVAECKQSYSFPCLLVCYCSQKE